MVTSNFGDYFAQATIDFMLGHRTTSVFSEFLLQLSSTDPREILKVSKIRASAIETTASRVLLENEHCVNAWTLLSPVDVGVTVSDKFVEKILLLSNSAIYIVVRITIVCLRLFCDGMVSVSITRWIKSYRVAVCHLETSLISSKV
jgi:hypothetical protein